MYRLEAMEVGHRYGRRILFRRLSIVAASGEAWAITGANGSGKSTLLKILAGLLRPSRGTVTLMEEGRTLSAEEHPLRIGVVAPYVNVYDDLTLRENLAFVARARSIRSAGPRIGELAAIVGLEAQVDEPIATYSTGMAQRARLAAALVHSPGVMLLDEPTISLDESARALCERIVADTVASGGIVVIASNDASDIALAQHEICVEDYARLTAPREAK